MHVRRSRDRRVRAAGLWPPFPDNFLGCMRSHSAPDAASCFNIFSTDGGRSHVIRAVRIVLRDRAELRNYVERNASAANEIKIVNSEPTSSRS
ncbi:hypothetical protein EVAR_4140_1 [Eumeta japonica]|uniref:Uncharacterized protein n=1 Tax=Eumeta variegata TaxID=151549 RepID=A0A4C1TGW7_EUMVA|nr:hypothetical protein EVAR_4140_1 [Eumeta japonica]